jgi:hypothetical protein
MDQTNLGRDGEGILIEDLCQGWLVSNNIIHDTSFDGINSINETDNSTLDNSYLNNTFYNTGLYGIRLQTKHQIVKNNIFDGATDRQIAVTPTAVSGGFLSIDYNDYWDASGGTKVGSWNGGSVLGFAAWKTASGGDAHAINSDPVFTSTTAPDFHLQGTSPAINAGLTIGSVTVDYASVSRPQGAAYDIGAYEQ